MKPETFNTFRQLVRESCGIALGDSKAALVSARLARRLRELSLPDEASYLIYLKANPEELITLVDLIATNVTRFFRDLAQFETLKNIFRKWRKEGVDRVRIWSSGCSSGEEPYSVAMIAKEYLSSFCDVKILATDISVRILEKAQAGIYADENLRDVPDELRAQYFLRHGREWRIHPMLNEMILFRRLNLVQEPWPIKGPFDIIFCRNVMIYFDTDLRRKLVTRYFHMLRPGGIFFVSQTESLAGIMGNFQMKQPSIYERAEESGLYANRHAIG